MINRRQFTVAAGLVGAGISLTSHLPRADATVPASDEDHPEVVRFTSQDGAIRYIGQPVNSQIGARAPRVGQEDGRWVEYQVYKGSPETDLPGTFVVTDLETGVVVRSIKLPTAEACADLAVASDGKVYLPTYRDYRLWQYDPSTKAVTDLGPIDASTGRADAFGAGPGPDGSVFLGVYPESRVYRYDPAAGVIHNLGTIDAEEDYIHFVCWDPDSDAVFCTVGGRRASIWRIEDRGNGARSRILDGSTIPILDTTPFLGTLDCINGHLVSRAGGSLIVTDLDGNVEYFTGGREIAAFHAVPTQDGNGFFFSAFGQVQRYDFGTHSFTPTAAQVRSYIAHGLQIDRTRIAGTDGGGPFVVDVVTGERIEHAPSFRQPTKIQKIFPGPGDTLYASGYMKGLAKINTEGGEPNATLNEGQYESWIVRQGQLYLGSYGYSKFSRYDPATPNVAPKQLFTSVGVDLDRPFGMAYDPGRDEAYMASVPLFGRYQGGMAIYEFATGKVTQLRSALVVDQSIVSVVHNPHDGLVYLGTTIDGGMGNDPISVTTEGQLIVFDPASRSVVRRSVPVPGRQGVTGLLIGPDGSVWGVAEEQLFRLAPDGGLTVHGAVSGRYPAAPSYTWTWANLNWSAMDGGIYGTAGGRLFRVDPSTGAITMLADGGAAWGATDTRGDVYFAFRTRLFTYLVPQPITGLGSDQKCLAVRAAREGRALDTSSLSRGEQTYYTKLVERVRAGHGPELEQAYCPR